MGSLNDNDNDGECLMTKQRNARAAQRTRLWLTYTLAALVCAVLLTAGYLWWTLLSPYGYRPPPELPAIVEDQYQIFAYGTLRHYWVRQIVIGSHEPPEPAHLPGYRREGLNIVPDPDDQVEGVVFVVNQDQLASLDRYERLGVRYQRVLKSLSDESLVWVYRRLSN